MEKKILTLHLADEWYQKILSGEKTEEYRECSVYWVMRLIAKDAPNRIELIYDINIAREKGAFMYGYVCQGGAMLPIVRKIEHIVRRYCSPILMPISFPVIQKTISRISSERLTKLL